MVLLQQQFPWYVQNRPKKIEQSVSRGGRISYATVHAHVRLAFDPRALELTHDAC